MSALAISRQLIARPFLRGHRTIKQELTVQIYEEYGNPVNDGAVFWVRVVTYDLAVKVLSDTPAGDVLYGHRIDETSFAEGCVSSPIF